MKKILSVLFIGFAGLGYSQSFGNLNINQRFDVVYNQLYGPIYNINSSTNNTSAQGMLTWDKTKLYEQVNGSYTSASIASQDALGSTRSGSLEALLRMYEITCDQKYLWEFMEQATQIINCRADKVVPQQSGSPYLFVNKVPWHGRILFPLAHFVHLVRSRNLGSTIIPVSHRVNFNNKTTIGEFSDFVNVQNREMMDFLLTQFWRTGDECMCKPASISEQPTTCKTKTGSNAIMELNFQAPFGSALLYMYLANTNEVSYGVKVVEMARAYLFSHGTVLNVDGQNAYWWYHSGWQKTPGSGSNWSLRNEFYEDIGHGAWDIMFPILYNKYYSSFYGPITGGQYFEDYQLVRFRNTFTKKIYWQPAINPCADMNAFYCNVVSSCSGNYPPNTYSGYQMNAKNWTGFYKYDNVTGAQTGPSVYSIMMNYYITVESCLPITEANYGGVCIVGLADLAVANYDKENILCQINVGGPKSTIPIQVSPNPSKDHFNISFDNDERKISMVKVVDLSGKIVLNEKNTWKITVTGLKEGIYILNVTFDDGSETTEKIIIKD